MGAKGDPVNSLVGAAARGAIAGAVSLAVAVPTNPADAAGNIYPSGCDGAGYDAGWSSFCWTGVSYNRTGTYVGAAQAIMQKVTSLLVNVDCVYGVTTGQRATQYQSLYGLTSDAVIGPQTWGHMRNWLTISQVVPTEWGFWWFWSAPNMSNGFKYQTYNLNPSADSWFMHVTYPPGNTGYGQMNVADIQGCSL